MPPLPLPETEPETAVPCTSGKPTFSYVLLLLTRTTDMSACGGRLASEQ